MKRFFNFCPKCKSENLDFSHGNKIKCLDCNFEYFHNVAGAVAVIIQKKEEILFTLRNKEPKKGLLDLAGGFIDPGESAEYACFRELKEELSVEINLNNLKYINSNPNTYEYKGILYNTIDLFYLYKDDDFTIEKFDPIELKGLVWKKLSDLNFNELAFESQKITLKLLKEKGL